MTPKGWSSPGDQNPSAKLLQGLCSETTASRWTAPPWRALTWGSISLRTGAPPAEASRGSWWSPTGKSRRRGRNLRLSSLAQTGQRTL
uniref:Uncharacterized protein n=1 Tax=Terrapene triunguis TaxID=2587831 RepID=A0A674KGF2_9SAUR